MKAIDTFRAAPWKHNCAQAVAHHWKHLYDCDDIVAQYAPYIGGHAPQGYCGALYAAMQACPLHASEIETAFIEACGAATCYDIKHTHHTPCEKCVETADHLLEKYSSL